jgi:hypothetical protein
MHREENEKTTRHRFLRDGQFLTRLSVYLYPSLAFFKPVFRIIINTDPIARST